MRWIASGLLLASLSFSSAVDSEPDATLWRSGLHYAEIAPANRVHADRDKVEVIVLFSYGSKPCQEADRALARWLAVQPSSVRLTRIPVSWDHARAYARLFYVLQTVNRSDLQSAVYEEIFQHGNRMLSADDEQTFSRQLEFATSHGIPAETFKAAYSSPFVDGYVQWASDAVREYPINTLPTIIVNDKYLTDSDRAGGAQNLVPLMSFLVERELSDAGIRSAKAN